MAHCEGTINALNERQRWLCHGPKSTLKVDIYKKMLVFKRWCVSKAPSFAASGWILFLKAR